MNNPHLGADALKFLDEIIPDTPSMQVVGEQEAMRIQLTQVLRDARKISGMTHEEIAAAIDKDVEWVRHVEDCNHPHTWDDFVTYVRALNANFEIMVSLPNGETIKLNSSQINSNAQ